MGARVNVNPHDLLWISKGDALVIDSPLPEWFTLQEAYRYPVVVRREALSADFIPVGIRGFTRSQRLAAKIHYADIVKRITPEEVVINYRQHTCKSSLPAIKALQSLMDLDLPWIWGVTGSTAYQLVTGMSVMNEYSDLDLLFRCQVERERDSFVALSTLLDSLSCKIDAQIETPNGAFALKEYIRGHTVMLKAPYGPLLTATPWAIAREI